jgi:1,4-dihydroxy-2-naphthoate octaprenyltransferase
MIFLPLLLGQAFAWEAHGQFSALMFMCALLFGALYQVYLLYTNDHADAALDLVNTQYWLSGGSRVLPEGKLGADDLLSGARIALAALAVLTLLMALFGARPWLPVFTLLVVLASWAYHRPPLQLAYRGHGEIPQGLACGVLLPLLGFYFQQGSLQQFPWPALVPLYLLFHAGNIITALPDYSSDKAGGKRTFAVRQGELKARITAIALLALAFASVPFVAGFASWAEAAIIVLPAVIILTGLTVSGLLHNADVANFPACKAFVTWVTVSQAWLLCAWPGVLLIGGAR